MKFIAFNGSPAGKSSATNKIIEAFLDGAKNAGAEVDIVQLMDYEIKQCRGCFHCWFKNPGKCVLKDDMAPLLKKYLDADVVIFGSPVYSWNMTGLLKNFVDRLVPLKSPLLSEIDGDYDMIDTEKRTQKYVTISNCGFPGTNNFEIIKAAFSICNPTFEIYRNCGKLLVSKQESVKPAVNDYLENVRNAGYELESLGYVTDATQTNLRKPIMSDEDYIKFLGMM